MTSGVTMKKVKKKTSKLQVKDKSVILNLRRVVSSVTHQLYFRAQTM